MFLWKRIQSLACAVMLLVFAGGDSHAFSREKRDQDKLLTIATAEWKGWANADGTGFYFDLARMIYEPEGYEIKVIFCPFPRCKAMIENKIADVMFSVYPSESDEDPIQTPRLPLDMQRVVVVFPRDFVWQGLKSLKGQRALMPRGYSYSETLVEDIDFVEVNDTEQGLVTFLRGREKFFITDLDELPPFLRKYNFDVARYRIETLYQTNLFLGVVRSPKGDYLREIYDHKLPQLIDAGIISSLYHKWGFPEKDLRVQ